MPRSRMESEEVWVIQNPGGSWRHPVHIHFEEHRMLTRNGAPVKPNTQLNGAIDYARRDVVNLQTNDETRHLHALPRHEGAAT